jgi:hypothetical protein
MISFTSHVNSTYVVNYWDNKHDSEKTVISDPIEFASDAEMIDYIDLVLDMILQDKDASSFKSIDLVVKGFPIVNLALGETAKALVKRTFAFRLKQFSKSRGI